MLRALSGVLLVFSLTVAGCSGSTSDDSAPRVEPTTVAPAASGAQRGVLTLRIGTVINAAAPTAARDRRTVDALEVAAALTVDRITTTIESISIDGSRDVAAAVAALAERGVTVIASTCDEATTGALLEAAVEAGLLAVTGCAELPEPTDGGPTGPLFIDLASLDDAADAMAEYAVGDGRSVAAVVRSTLIGDVAETCVDFEGAFLERGGSIALSAEFEGLVETPTDVLTASAPLLASVDVFALCGLPEVLGDAVASIRAAGYDQPIVVPWFGADSEWPPATDDVFVVALATTDDPRDEVVDFLDELGETARAVDVVSADVVALLARAAARAASVGSTRIESMLLGQQYDAFSGSLFVDPGDRRIRGREYRVLAVSGGAAQIVSSVTAGA